MSSEAEAAEEKATCREVDAELLQSTIKEAKQSWRGQASFGLREKPSLQKTVFPCATDAEPPQSDTSNPGAGTEDATLPEDWIAPTGCCERNPLVVTPTLLLVCVPNTLSFASKKTLWIPLFITADTSMPGTIISTLIINTAQQD